MNNTLFISEAKLKQNSDVIENVDAKYVRNAILKAQTIKLQPVLGSDLYEKLEDLIITGAIGATGASGSDDNTVYKNLLDNEVQQAIIPFAVSNLLVSLSYKITNKGTMQSDDELSTPLDLDTIQYLRTKNDEDGQYWLNRVTAYCQEFYTELPEYSNPDTNDYRTIPPDSRNNWSTAIHLDRGSYKWGSDDAPNTGEPND